MTDAFRAIGRNRAEPVAELPDGPVTADGPEHRLLAAEMSARLGKLLSHLTPRQREVLVLRLAVGLSAANTHDSLLLEPMVDVVLAVIGPRGRPGRPRKRPAKLHADKGYDRRTCRRALRRRGSPAVGWNPALGWAASAGRSSGPWLGCWPTGA